MFMSGEWKANHDCVNLRLKQLTKHQKTQNNNTTLTQTQKYKHRLPNENTRKELLAATLKSNHHNISNNQLMRIAKATNNYSCADIASLCREAAMASFKNLDTKTVMKRSMKIPPISFDDFQNAIQRTRATVSPGLLARYNEFNAAVCTK